MKTLAALKNFTRKSKTLKSTAVILFLLLSISGCYEFDFVNQPYTGEPDSYFDVQISVTLQASDGSGSEPIFGVLLPLGWSVDDTLFFLNTTTNDTGRLVYNNEFVQQMNSIDPPPEEYFWWVGAGAYQVYTCGENLLMEMRIYTNSKTGSFLLDYMIGDEYLNGINFLRSNNHVITVDAPQSLTVTNTNDNGPGSFRAAIDSVDFYGTINFSIDPSDTLVLESELNIYKNLSINGPEEGNLVISGNNEVRVLRIEERNVDLSNLTIINGRILNGNYDGGLGGGLFISNSTVNLSNIIIKNNSSSVSGGGLYAWHSNIIFDTLQKCSIYDNFSLYGNDLMLNNFDTTEAFLNEFSVLNPTLFHALGNIIFNIDFGIHEQTQETMYVSPNGSNLNNGLSFDEPLKTINVAFSKSLASAQNEQIIILDSGEYKLSNQGAYYPLGIPNYISLQGVSSEKVFLNAEGKTQVIKIINNPGADLFELTIKGGYSSGNMTHDYGGGIHCDQSNLILQNVNVTENFSNVSSGGIFFRDSHAELTGVLVDNNTCFLSGGGISCFDTTKIIIKESVITNNHVTGYNGGWGGGGISFSGETSSLLENVLISGNTATVGGGIYCSGIGPTITNSTIAGNAADDIGGGIYSLESDPTIINSVILNNSADYAGGGIYLSSSNAQIINSTISQNQVQNANEGGGVYCTNSIPTLINTIVWNNNPNEIYCWGSSVVTVSTTDIMGGRDGIIVGPTSAVNWLEGNIDEDPLFTMSGAYPYQINDYSPCIGVGTPDTTGLNLPEFDLAGNPRIVNNRIDMGAYEWNMFVGIEEPVNYEPQTAKVSIYPNPANDHLFIDFELESETYVMLEIYTVSGKRIKALNEKSNPTGNQHFEMNTQGLPPGIYFLRLQAENEVVTKKIIKL